MKRLAKMLLLVIMMISFSNIAVLANDGEESNRVYSPEFPQAYIEIESEQKGTSDQNVVGSKSIRATVYVKEVYSDDGARLMDSTLLSKKEVEKIGKKNFSDIAASPNSSIYPGTTETYKKLQLTFSIPSQPATNKYKLRAYAKWSGGSGVSGPASGDDFVGFAWGGGFDYSGASISGKTTNGASMSFRSADAVPNAGKVWGFSEYSPKMDYLNAYITLNKSTLTGHGNTTSFMAKYIHTYQESVGSISITAGESGVGAGFTLSSCAKQWSLVADLSGFKY